MLKPTFFFRRVGRCTMSRFPEIKQSTVENEGVDKGINEVLKKISSITFGVSGFEISFPHILKCLWRGLVGVTTLRESIKRFMQL